MARYGIMEWIGIAALVASFALGMFSVAMAAKAQPPSTIVNGIETYGNITNVWLAKGAYVTFPGGPWKEAK